ncbi:hypothetical protein N7489_000288 [Penicillium chrysogenum]|uniref:uncharacterized protein n=1 Tax=Penicillium chrysogenum TaxID=5076 RepID=UPI0024DF157A|nr:uncharacterized protein N7489_000288 [Penicillium chrysogenum]KAJ5249878.1 hypothetical protein N7489_000288 [Penicillium chrysogenum]
MIFPGHSLITRSIIRNVKYPTLQAQPCGVDLTLKHLAQGSYLVEFNETVSVPLDLMGEVFVRSSLFRSGVTIHAGVMDSGYEGAVGALMQVVNPTGLRLYPAARLAQFVFHQMSEEVKGYNGVYQGMTDLRSPKKS